MDGSGSPLLERITRIPKPFDEQRVERVVEDLTTQINGEGDEHGNAIRFLTEDEDAQRCLASIAGNSPFLSRLILRDPLSFLRTLRDNPEQRFDDLLHWASRAVDNATSETEVMSALRVTKAKAALTIATADTLGVWALSDVTERLSRLADCALDLALRHLLREAQIKEKIVLEESATPEQQCGLALIAMGKYGAFELNYSSDIDFVAFFDRDKVGSLIKSDEPHSFCIRLTRGVVKLIQESTGDGYVFRTDLRLRPDAGATAVALSTTAAENYYESMGQNWERAAMIKARPAAGDKEVGSNLLGSLKPFVWRKYLDFAAIEDIHSIKRQIHTFRGHSKLAVAGHNIKLGVGGIREIEFFTQTQQLILGGRNPQLRGPTTCGALRSLAENQMISKAAAEELIESYEFFRLVEHRLQMVEDQQTHVIPEDEPAITGIAYFSGYSTRNEFEEAVAFHLTRVNKHYSALFEKEDPLTTPTGNLVFTGVEDDPETLRTLETLGFERAEDVSKIIRSWHFGRIPATRSERARELLTKLIPAILEAIANTPEPDATFLRYSDFLTGLPSGVQLFSLFFSYPELLYVLVEALGLAPRLAPYLSKNSGVFDALLEPDFLGTRPKAEELSQELERRLQTSDIYEVKLDLARRWCKDEMFRIGLQLLRGRIGADEAGRAYSELGGSAITEMAFLAASEVQNQHGDIPGGEYIVLGMGKLGGCELSASSDLDIMVIYDHDGDFAASDGAKPLHVAQYYTRFTQRLIAGLSAPTAEGSMYEVDMQLRPSGKAGPIAVHYASFRRYYSSEAWNWELMALTRARVICGSASLAIRAEKIIEGALLRDRNRQDLASSLTDMRAKMESQKGSANPWELKHVRGGLVDLEFIVQFLQLVHGKAQSGILNTNTRASLEQIKRFKVVNAGMVNKLMSAADLFTALNQYTKLCCDGAFEPRTAGESLRSLLAERIGLTSFEALEKQLVSTQRDVLEIFEDQIVSSAD